MTFHDIAGVHATILQDKARRLRVALSADDWRPWLDAATCMAAGLIVLWVAPVELLVDHLIFCLLSVSVVALALRYDRLPAGAIAVANALAYSVAWATRLGNNGVQPRIEAFCLLLIALVTSELTAAQRQNVQMQHAQNTQLQQDISELHLKDQQVIRANRDLEQQVKAMPQTLATVLRQMADLRQLSDQKQLQGIVQLLSAAASIEQCSLYARNGDGWRLIVRGPHSPNKAVPPEEDPLVALALAQQRAVGVFDALAQCAAPVQCSLLVAPMYDEQSALHGLVVVDALPIVHCTPLAAQTLAALVAVLQPMLIPHLLVPVKQLARAV